MTATELPAPTVKTFTCFDVDPFTDEYVQSCIEWYGVMEHEEKLGDDHLVISPAEVLGRCDDYLNKNFRIWNLTVPRLFVNGTLWMSLTPMEIQSQFLAIRRAAGDVCVAGLGMGYAVLRMAEKEEVDSIVVFEKEDVIVRFFNKMFSDRPGFEKIQIILGDARETFTDYECDFAYVDIYEDMCSDAIAEDIHLFTSVNYIHGQYHPWCIERILLEALSMGLIDASQMHFDERDFLRVWHSHQEESGMFECMLDEEYLEPIIALLDAMRE